MVVVSVRPTRCIDLSRGNADGPQGGHREGAFFATTPRGGAHRGQRRGGAGIGRTIGDILMTPVVDFQHSLTHREVLHPLFEFFIFGGAERVKVLIVDARRHNKVEPFAARHFCAPRHFAFRPQSGVDAVAIVFKTIVGHVGPCHISIKEAHGFHRFARQLFFKSLLRDARSTEVGTACFEVGINLRRRLCLHRSGNEACHAGVYPFIHT